MFLAYYTNWIELANISTIYNKSDFLDKLLFELQT